MFYKCRSSKGFCLLPTVLGNSVLMAVYLLTGDDDQTHRQIEPGGARHSALVTDSGALTV